MKKFILKLKLKYEESTYYKNMKLKKEIKTLKKLLEETRVENHKLIDEITLKNLKIRDLYLNKEEK